MRLDSIVAGWCFVVSSAALGVTGESGNLVMGNRVNAVAYYGWNVEAAVQFISMADETDAMIGSGLYYQLTDFFEIGGQTLLTANEGGNSSVRLVARQYFTDGETKLFAQPAVAYNLHRNDSVSVLAIETGSIAADVGIKHRLWKDVHIGGTTGLELVDKGRYYKRPEADREYLLTPRLALVTNVDF